MRKSQNLQCIEIASVSSFCEAVSRLRKEWCGKTFADGDLWFRGHHNCAWPLVPPLYRHRNPLEDDLRCEFERIGTQLITENRPSDYREWYFLMQHFGAPTRLLDWTDGALLALYFALRSAESGCDAAVWALEPTWLNSITAHNKSVLLPGWDEASGHLKPVYGGRIRVKFPIAIDPTHVSRRLAVQHSRFTIHGTARFGLEEIAVKAKRPKLMQFRIPDHKREAALNDLNLLGIVETTVFPDLQGLSRELTLDWTDGRISDQEITRDLERSLRRWRK